MLGRSPPVFTPNARRRWYQLSQLPPIAGASLQVPLWDWQSCSWWRMSLLLLDRALLERWPLRLLSWQSSRLARPNAFGSITMSLTNCARGPPRTMKSPSLLFRWSLFATMITTWIDTLVEKDIPIVIGYGWISRQGYTSCGRSAETTRQRDSLLHVMRLHYVSCPGCPFNSRKDARCLSKRQWTCCAPHRALTYWWKDARPFFFARRLHRISRILAVLNQERVIKSNTRGTAYRKEVKCPIHSDLESS